MHMADALISPEVGGGMWAASVAALAWSAKKINGHLDSEKVPLMGVMGAFIFAGQMINFTIPGTGSSGHICGSLLLSVLLGPYAALIVIASVLIVQALLFADGGLLALGCNIFNMGVLPCFVAYPLIYRTIAGTKKITMARLWGASITASVVGLQLGALAVVFESYISGVSDLSFSAFAMLMLPIHLAIGFIEGIITATVLLMIREAKPGLLSALPGSEEPGKMRGVLTGLAVCAFFTAGIISWFASDYPDGLEWSIAGSTGHKELSSPNTEVYMAAEAIQSETSIMPEYTLPDSAESTDSTASWGKINPIASLAGLSGGVVVLLFAFSAGLIFRKRKKRPKSSL